VIRTKQLRHRFQSDRQFEFPDLYCESGKSLLILGPSGCGKSTLLHLLCGILKPVSGSIHILNEDITQFNLSKSDAFRGQHIGVVLQKAHFISSLNVLENLLLFQTISGQKSDLDALKELLHDLGLSGLEKQKIQTLSQGEVQRLNMARALIHKPALILADEPTASLDDKNAERIANILNMHSEKLNAALVIVTHDMRLKTIFNNHILLS
jgi:lipoprotein-releasing system ATP-binding protein